MPCPLPCAPSILQRTFIHGEGIGAATERNLWNSRARTWGAFLDRHRAGELCNRRYARLAPLVEESQLALGRREIEFFERRLPSGEKWRLYSDFADRVAFVDIETTGLRAGFDQITVVGLYDGESFRAFVRGKNLDDFPNAVADYPLLVTYNGATFDVPFLQATFRGFAPRAHLDLRHPLRRLGFTGGLKNIEVATGISRPSELRDIDGFEAVRLWHLHRGGHSGALERLVAYCRQDVINLAPLAARVAADMPARIGCP